MSVMILHRCQAYKTYPTGICRCMDEKITALGFAILAAGLLLFFGYMPLVGESAEDIADDYDDGNFEDYETGDRVTVYGKLTDMEYISSWNLTKLIIDDEEDVPIYVEGNITGSLEKGKRIYVKCFIDDFRLIGRSFEYLRAHPDDIHYRIWTDVIFGSIAVVGTAVLIVGIRRI